VGPGELTRNWQCPLLWLMKGRALIPGPFGTTKVIYICSVLIENKEPQINPYSVAQLVKDVESTKIFQDNKETHSEKIGLWGTHTYHDFTLRQIMSSQENQFCFRGISLSCCETS